MWIDGVSYSQICPPADFGDAPDTGSSTSTGNYQTKSTDNGPSHRIIAGLSLGTKVDADNGSLQNANADADDTTGEGDEDGLINPPIVPTTANQPYTLTAYVTNNTNEAAYLTTYIDFNRDGDFLDAGEKADTQYIYSNGYYYPTFTLPSGLTAGTTYARLRLSQTQSEAESPNGPSSSGEVEDYKLTISSSPYYDFGDAPASYGAARHTISNNLRLGDNPADAETASYYSFNANGDNYDEDGAPHQSRNPRIALFPILKTTTTSYSVDIKATNTTGSTAKLYGWIDFDQNGAFQADEAASASVPNNTDGTVTLTWNSIPTDIKLGTTFIRLRLTTDASVTTSTPTGNASNGEVEDYPIAVAIDIPPNSPNVTIVRGETAACSSTVFTDNFDDLPAEQYFGENTSTTPYVIRNWTATGGGNDTYARTVTTMFTSQGTSVYFGNGFMRRIYPDIGISPTFDGNGKLLAPPTAIELRDDPDDTTPGVHSGEADWGPNPVKLSRTFATIAGQKYRLYFAAIPEDAGNDYYGPGIMRVDTPSGSIHFKAPGGTEGLQHYQIEFTATGSSSTISFVNYGHIGTDDHLCDPNSVITGAWCTVGGAPISRNGNELIIDDVTVALASACPSSNIRGFVYVDKNTNDTFDASTDSSLGNITVNLYDNNGTTNTTTDDNIVASTSTAADGSYSFNNVSSILHYRIEVDTNDTDLPARASIGTTNPLADVTVSSNSTLANQNFGFDISPLACTPPSPTTTGANSSITWNHNPYTPISQVLGGHPVPAILNTGLIASAANEVASNLTVGPTDWEEYTETSTLPTTLAQAISGNKYFQYSFTTQSSLANDHILYGVAMSTLGPLNTWNHSGKYKIQIQFDDNAAFSSPTVIKNLIQIDEDNPTTGGNVSEGPLYGSDYYISHYDLDTPVNLAANKTYYIRFYLYGVSKTGVANSVSNRIIMDDLLLKTYDCGAAPDTYLNVGDAVVTEGDSGLTYLNFPVQLSAAAPAGGVSFDYATADDTATTADSDYQAKAGNVTIPVGANGSVISIPVVGDTKVEPNEKLSLNISNVTNAQFFSYPKPPRGTIIDDDAEKACNAASGQFGGIIFQDYNQNGLHESGEIGLAGVTVTAYNSSNATAATATTDANGWYVLTGLTNGSQYRLEFSNLPAGVESGATGVNSGSNVQFITASATCDADMGIYNPVDYCQVEPKLLTSRYVNGDTSISTANMAGTFGALLSYDYSASGIAPSVSQDALGSQVGGIWGLAYNRTTKKAFASAVVRRHMGMGPLGIGGIYVVDYSAATPTVSNFLNVDGLAGIDVGSINSNTARGLAGDPFLPSHDPTVFDKVGKEGLGDLELSDDGNTLYAANLFSRKIIKIDLTTYNSNGTVPSTASEISLPAISCNNGVARPFGLKYYRGKLYAGITCTGENGGSSADLKAYVEAYDGSSWVEKLQIPLNYSNWHADHMRASEYLRNNIPWVSNFSNLKFGDHGSVQWADDSQLLLSGIEFDANGDMLLGFIDRTGLQFGQVNYSPDVNSTAFYGVFSNGELLKAPYNASTGSYTLENAGVANGIAGEGAKTGADPAWPYGGIGGGEFYGGDKFLGHTENSFGALAVIPGRQELALNAMNPFNVESGGTLWLNNNTGTRTRGAQLYAQDNRYFGKAVGLGDIEALCDTAPIEVGNRVWLDSDKDGIQDANESGINNVTVTLACGAASATTTTNAAGEYYFSNKTGGNASFMKAGASCTLKVNSSQASLSSYALTTQNADGKTDNNRFTDIRDSDAVDNAGTAEISFTVGGVGQNNHSLDFGYHPISSTLAATTTCDKSEISIDISHLSSSEKVLINLAQGAAGTQSWIKTADTSGTVTFKTPRTSNGSYTALLKANTADKTAEASADCPAIASNGDITGVAFLDLNANGVLDNGTVFNEVGVADITVKAFDADDPANAPSATATTDASGNYSLAGLTDGTTYRIEFSNLQPGHYPTRAPSNNIQFHASPASNVNFGIISAKSYYRNTPADGSSNSEILTSIMTNGDQSTGTERTLVSIPYNASAPWQGDVSAQAMDTDTGSIYGIAYQPQTDRIFSGAYLKRHSGLGPAGLDAIYVTQRGTNSTSVFVELQDDLGINVGSIGSNASRGLGNKNVPSHDVDAFNLTGTIGIGDVDISEDGKTLYVTNLFDKTLYAIKIDSDGNPATRPTPADVTAYPIPAPALCSVSTAYTNMRINMGGERYEAADAEIWMRSSFHLDGQYGSVSNAVDVSAPGAAEESIYQTFMDYVSKIEVPLPNGAYTIKLHYADFWGSPTGRNFDINFENGQLIDPAFNIYNAAGGNGKAVVKSYEVTVNDGMLNIDFTANKQSVLISGMEIIGHTKVAAGNWRPFAIGVEGESVFVGGVCDAATSQNPMYLQATVYKLDNNTSTFQQVLSTSLDYNRGIGYSTCNGQHGWFGWLPANSFPSNCDYTGHVAVYPQPILSDIEFAADRSMLLGFRDRFGDQVGQDNYRLSGTTTMTGSASGDILRAGWSGGSYHLEKNASVAGLISAGTDNMQGPGGGEFYYQDNFGDGHAETSMGGLASYKGFNQLLYSRINPEDTVRTAGIGWLDNNTGEQERGYMLYNQSAQFLGKAAGLGDVEVVLELAPIEVGDRVWLDSDSDGIQDAGETGISNVSVKLTCGSDSATTTTNTDGAYYFSNAANGNAVFMNPGESCFLSVDGSQASVSSYFLSTQNADGQTDNNAGSDIRDSDAVTSGSHAIINFTAGNSGQSNYGLDFGYQTKPALNATIYSPPSYSVCKSTSVEQLDAFQYATATGSGAAGTPSLTYTAPAGSNRFMAVLLSVERDHTPVSNGRGDNFESNPGVTFPTVTYGGVALSKLAHSVDASGTSNNFTDAEFSRSYYLYGLFDLSIPSGANSLQVSGINAPANAGDDAILAVATFANVASVNPISSVVSEYSQTVRTAPFSLSLPASPAAPTAADQPPGTSAADNMLLAFGASTKPETLTIGAGWNKLAEIPVTNPNGTFAADSGRASGPFSENDGHTLLVQAIKGVSGNQTAAMGSASTNLSSLGMQVFRFVAHGCDYGDAPASYGDAFHSQSWSRRIGAQRGDAETATPTAANASGDDNDKLDDEDGVTIPALTNGQSATISVNVAGSAYLSAWIDWNGDGDFADAGEKIATDLQDSDADGTIQIPVSVPATATTSQTYARFRWSINTGAGPTGWASYGEVEDHSLTIAPNACQAPTASNAWSDELVEWMHNAGTPPGAAADTVKPYIRQPAYAASAGNETFNNLSIMVKDTVGYVTPSSVPSTVNTSKYIAYSFTTPAFTGVATLYGVGLGHYDQLSGAYKLKVQIDTDPAFGSPTTLINSIGIDDTQHSLDADAPTSSTLLPIGWYYFNHYQADQAEVLTPNTTYYVRVYPYNLTRSRYYSALGQNYAIYDDFVLKVKGCGTGTINGSVYLDSNGNNSYDSATESGIGSITVNLLSDVDGSTIATSNTQADGSYEFSGLSPSLIYRVSVNTTDTDLPAGATIGTANPLTGVTVTAGGTTSKKDFGFDPPVGKNLTGKVFDDVNYGGGAGRAWGTAGTTGVSGAKVELYGSSGTLISSTATASDGSYTFKTLAAGKYYVRVVNDTVKSTRSGSDGTERGIQTYRTDGSTAITKEVGGRKPNSVDTAANTTGQTLDTTTFQLSGGGQAQSVQPITMASSDISGVNFGFNFSTVVNTNDSGQGSLRQGILNINLLANTGLAQTGQDNTYGLDVSVIKEVLLFNIPASGDPLGRADICGGSVCKITVNSQLPAVAKQPAIIDATTQPGYVAGMPGAPIIQIAPVTGLDATGFVMDYDAPDSTFRGFAITGFQAKNTNRGLTINSERTLVESNYIGVTPTGTADGNSNGIELQWTQTAVIGGSSAAKRNIVSANKALGIFFNTGASGSLIQNNYIGVDPTGAVAMGNGTTGIDTEGGSGTKILNNIIAGNQNNGIELGFTSGGPGLANAIIQGNRIGVGVNGEAIGNGVGIMDYGVSGGHAIGGAGAGAGNIIAYNTAAGVSLANNSVASVVISANSIYANGGLGIDLGNNGVTVNDANDADSGANTLLNFPVLQQITLSNGNIIARGCAPAGAVVEFFKADVSPGGAATPGANRFGLSTDYGEGQTYVGSLVEGSAADSDAGSCSIPSVDGNNHTGMQAFQFSVPVPANLAEGDYLTATATLAAAGTSEFGPTTAIIGGPPPVGSGSCAATGGSDILFIVDNSGSITTSEYADFSATIKTVGSQLLADNPANRIATAHFGGPPYSLVSGGQYVYIERDFSNTAMSTPVRRFGVGGAYNSAWSADHLAGALQQIRYALDGKASTASNYIVSPLKEMSHNTSTPLQIVLMTDAVRYGDGTPSDISMLIDPVGSGAEPNDGSNFTIYNQLKAEGVSFSVASFNPNPTDIAASAAIASVGGAYTGKIEANPKDPEGSQATPRRFISVTAGFKLTAAQIDELVEGTAICSSTISGVVFDDVNYGGGNGRALGTTGTAGIAGATVEVYDSTGAYVANTTTSADGSYKLPNLPDADYFVRVVSDTVNSSRANANGSELGVMTYRSNGTTAVLNEVGGRKPANADGGANSGSSTLNTSTFVFSGGALAGKPAQVLQKISLTGSSVKNVDFGFNFDTVVNANDSGQGSLRQFLLNANLLGGDATLAQSGRTAGVENAILLLSTSDPNYNSTGNYWNIALKSQLPVITSKLTLDGSTQSGFVGTPVLRLNGSAAGSVNGLTLTTGSDHSLVKALAIQQFGGTGILLNDSAGNTIGGPNNGDGNVITGNGGSGVAVTGNAALDNSILGNSIYANGGLGIDLANDGVTANDSGDADNGPNSLLNYPETPINAFGTNGTRVITYDLTLDVPAGSYRLEFFTSAAKDPSGNGEGQTFLGSKDITHSGTGAQNFKGVFNANQSVASGAFIAATLTRKGNDPGGFGPTSEFSGVRNSAATAVCTELTSGSGADMVVDENYPTITLLKAKDSNGNPINYVVSGGADKAMFTITAPVVGATLDCATVKFIEYNIIITRDAPLEAETRAIVLPDSQPNPGDYELPQDSDKNNVYQFQITATYADGQHYTRDFSVQVSNVNEAPTITSAAAVSFNEDSSAAVLDIASQDPDAGTVEGNGLTYSITGGADARLLSVEPASGILKFRAPPDYDAPTDTNRDNVYEAQVTVTDSGGLSNSKLFQITVVNNPADDGALLNVKTLLQGAYDSNSGLMSGDLNALGLLPPKQPYTAAPFNYSGTETLSSLVQEATGNSAIVDWVLVDLRTSPTSIAATRALMLRRDGQVVDAQTGSPDLHFANVKAGNYYVSVRHRNHLGVITASPLSLDHSVRMVNFASSSTVVRGDEARLLSGKTAMLWAGDVNGSNTLTANGPGNDVTSLLSGVITAMDNLQGNTNHIMKGYLLTDLNLDGKTLFTGPGNDTSLLMGNIILHPLNPNFAANYIVRGGLSQ